MAALTFLAGGHQLDAHSTMKKGNQRGYLNDELNML